MLEQFADNLKRLRTDKGISQEYLTNKIHVHSNHLSRYERGISAPFIAVIVEMAKALDVSIEELIFGAASAGMKKISTTRNCFLCSKKYKSSNSSN